MSSMPCHTLVWILMSFCTSLSSPRTTVSPLKAMYWLTRLFLSATRQWFLTGLTTVYYSAPCLASASWSIKNAFFFVCVCVAGSGRVTPSATILGYMASAFHVMLSTNASHALRYLTCCSVSVGDRRNPKCRLLGPQQQWGAVKFGWLCG